MIKTFELYGMVFKGKSGDQVYGDCIFFGKEDKFYLNTFNFLWDCKVCGRKGNSLKFLSEVYETSLKNMSEKFLEKLAINRRLPLKALQSWKFGRYKNKYVLPIRNEKGIIAKISFLIN